MTSNCKNSDWKIELSTDVACYVNMHDMCNRVDLGLAITKHFTAGCTWEVAAAQYVMGTSRTRLPDVMQSSLPSSTVTQVILPEVWH